jgi:hypothetical protein
MYMGFGTMRTEGLKIESVLKNKGIVIAPRWRCKGFRAFKKRCRNSALRDQFWRELRVKYRLCLGLDESRGV